MYLLRNQMLVSVLQQGSPLASLSSLTSETVIVSVLQHVLDPLISSPPSGP